METGWALKCGQRDALPHAQIHISSRHRSRRKRNPSASSPAGGPVGRGQKRSRVDRLRQSQSRQDHDGIVRSRFDGPFDRRTVQDHGRRRLRSRAVSWCGAGFERSSRRTSRDIVCWDRRIDRESPRQGQQAKISQNHRPLREEVLPRRDAGLKSGGGARCHSRRIDDAGACR